MPGVLDESDEVIDEIAAFEDAAGVLGESDATDVTGGMAAKVRALLALEAEASIFGLEDLEAFLARSRERRSLLSNSNVGRSLESHRSILREDLASGFEGLFVQFVGDVDGFRRRRRDRVDIGRLTVDDVSVAVDDGLDAYGRPAIRWILADCYRSADVFDP